ncbi:MAG: phosphate ABC transporter permease PstA [Syntrophobacteraceae bacterium]|jgi:phosphate transport system permease protein|nr:phosphate ABC transporter permease PstA [Syntrophobacteraceae bacterium]
MNRNLEVTSIAMSLSSVEALAPAKTAVQARRAARSDLTARGEPFLWGFGGALALGLMMVFGFLVLILWNGLVTFYPKPIKVLTLRDGSRIAGEPVRSEYFRPSPQQLQAMDDRAREMVAAEDGMARRTLYRTGNFDLYNEDFKWVPDYNVAKVSTPSNIYFIERMEWGPFVGIIQSLDLGGEVQSGAVLDDRTLDDAVRQAALRRDRIRTIEREDIGAVNHRMNGERLALRRLGIRKGEGSEAFQEASRAYSLRTAELQAQYNLLSEEARSVKEEDARFKVTLVDVQGRQKDLPLSQIVRLYPANGLSMPEKLGVFFSRWREFLTEEPREANTEGGVLPAIFGTFAMTILMAIAVAPFGVMTALYLREYARQGKLVSVVRICVNNLAGVPSIVYGVFGLGFFAYICGGSIDRIFYPERLPNPTFGTGGLLWSSLTLALLTVPVVIVATEEALAAVPQSMREGSLACGASKWQTIKHIILPRAMPGIMTGLILAMARGAGEVAPLMLVGVVKIAPELPIDQFFPFIHLERSFMHLGFHIFDVGFQSRNSEAGKPMVFVTTLLLISLVAMMNAMAIVIRNRLKRKFMVGHF